MSLSFLLLYCSTLDLISALTDIQFNDLSGIDLPTHVWAGISGIRNDTLYAIHGGVCATSDGSCSLIDRTAYTFTLDLSTLQLTGTKSKTISLGTSWDTITPINGIASNVDNTQTTAGYRTAGSVYIGQYAYAIYPSTTIFKATKSIMRYDMDTNSYTKSHAGPEDSWIQLPTIDYIETCNAHYNGYLYSIGGQYYDSSDTNKYAINNTFRLNIDTLAWDEMNAMPTARHRCSCAVLNGNIYALGGKTIHPNSEVLNVIERYDITNNIWYSETDDFGTKLKVARQMHISYTHPNNQWIITIGGVRQDSNNVSVPIEIFEPLTHRVYATDIMYWHKQFYATLYQYSADVSIIFTYGGLNDGTYYKDVKYMVMHKNDHIPSWSPTKYPTSDPTQDPTTVPTIFPTKNPTTTPTKYPTQNPSLNPTRTPSISPTQYPTQNPSMNPSKYPTKYPTVNPTRYPSNYPTKHPTKIPTQMPTKFPSVTPTKFPTIGPTLKPSKSPLEAGETHDPSADPTHNPITDTPTVNPTISPTFAPQTPLVFDPTKAPNGGGAVNEPTQSPLPMTSESMDFDAATFESSTVDSLNITVNYVVIGLIAFCVIFMIISFLGNRLVYTGCDPPNYFALLWVIMELYDFFSDVSFSIYLWYLKDADSEDKAELTNIFTIASVFIYLPYLLNLLYLTHRIRRWKQKLQRSAIGEWLAYWDWWLITLAMLCGGSHPSVEICNSLLFPMDAFGMHLPWTEIVRIRTERFCTTVLFENVPQLCIQLYLLASVQAVTGNSIIYLTILSSVGSIAFSGLYYFANQHKVRVGHNHWIFRMRLTSSNIEEHHKHSYYKLQVAISKSLEIPNVEWCRLTSVQQKTDELRCDGFISIPDQYLNKKQRKQSGDPQEQKEFNDMRRASEMYRNTFDENERNEFMHRLEAAKEEHSHYHQTLVKQLENDIKLNNLSLYFEIGAKQDREGVNGVQNLMPNANFAPEGNEAEFNNHNHTASVDIDKGPGNSVNEEFQRKHNGAHYSAINQAKNQKNMIEMAIVMNESNDKEVIEDETPGNSMQTISNIISDHNQSPFSVSQVNEALMDDEVDEIDNFENKDLNSNETVGSEPGSPEPQRMRTDDGMIQEMIDAEQGQFELNGRVTTKRKSKQQIVDEEVMFEMQNETFGGDIIDGELNLNAMNGADGGDIDVDVIGDNGMIETVTSDELLEDFEIETIQ